MSFRHRGKLLAGLFTIPGLAIILFRAQKETEITAVVKAVEIKISDWNPL